MLKIERDATVIKGTKIELLAEVTSLIHELVVEEKFFSKEDIDMCVETALLTEEELDKKTADKICNLSSEDIDKLIKSVLS